MTFEIAHIAAVSPGGARFDKKMTDGQRADITNLMLLCERHHKIVDSQRGRYTEEVLIAMKHEHEREITRGQLYAMSEVGFEELEAICASVRMLPSASRAQIDELVLPPEVTVKMRSNDLSDASGRIIKVGISKTTQVAAYISFTEGISPGFANRVRQWFLISYAQGALDGLAGDELFAYLCSVASENAGVKRGALLEAAAIAVVVHLFEICELFEAPDASAK
ncbi:hypothetical protein JOE38_001794 [Clavibacter michiganensis]|uniref:hypothetical protein n=1 Tax=Clavibacter michiganensis TaxID=28447 RepID=UPI001958B414|nr:hypothetical protein [Clavibacter michiganensis]MBM7411971.1 hypothetical protein [Clavibacter michiganensis]